MDMVSGNLVIRILGYHNGNYMPGTETIVVYAAVKPVECAKRVL